MHSPTVSRHLFQDMFGTPHRISPFVLQALHFCDFIQVHVLCCWAACCKSVLSRITQLQPATMLHVLALRVHSKCSSSLGCKSSILTTQLLTVFFSPSGPGPCSHACRLCLVCLELHAVPRPAECCASMHCEITDVSFRHIAHPDAVPFTHRRFDVLQFGL